MSACADVPGGGREPCKRRTRVSQAAHCSQRPLRQHRLPNARGSSGEHGASRRGTQNNGARPAREMKSVLRCAERACHQIHAFRPALAAPSGPGGRQEFKCQRARACGRTQAQAWPGRGGRPQPPAHRHMQPRHAACAAQCPSPRPHRASGWQAGSQQWARARLQLRLQAAAPHRSQARCTSLAADAAARQPGDWRQATGPLHLARGEWFQRLFDCAVLYGRQRTAAGAGCSPAPAAPPALHERAAVALANRWGLPQLCPRPFFHDEPGGLPAHALLQRCEERHRPLPAARWRRVGWQC